MNFSRAIGLLFLFLVQANGLHLINENLILDLTFKNNSIGLTLTLDEETKISGEIGFDTNTKFVENCNGSSVCSLKTDDEIFAVEMIDSGFKIYWESSNLEKEFRDCLDLNGSNTNWFGGPEKWQADWPVEKTVIDNRLYTTIKTDNGAVAERYWLNSKGGFVFVTDRVPLYLDQNKIREDSVCFIASATPPYINRTKVILEYYLVAKTDPKEAHLHAVNNFLGKPKEHPNEWIIRHPIWTTWAKYKSAINDSIVVSFAKDIADHGFVGQIEIDDKWEDCYGSLTFSENAFPEINQTVQAIKDLNFTVTIWTHPFVNHDCEETVTYGQQHGYFVIADSGSDETSWWNGPTAHHLDFSKEEVAKWFSDRLKLLQERHGIDGFKFDAGESDYAPLNPIVSGDPELSPNSLSGDYIRTDARFGGLTEVRTAWRTQDLPIFLRMLDKDSRWTLNNGLYSLITSLLLFNINGYVFVLPDMIGGNGYTEKPTPELMVRWTQANTFMPAMQFSYLPWEITSDDFDSLEITKKFVALHEDYADVIIEAMNNSIATGTPVNPPIWWVDPTNPDALTVNDEYLLGEKILVAPVVQEGAISRDVVLPVGSWKDGNNGTIYEGPQILKGYSAPIDILPYFIKQ
ncbi:myogenesis-regulating glycosidase [Tribolium madens]|uniref:myogenesis-regulating glycosidase n=1 Tax=Tribolium madens TaxID=41895 RepID=UPI001CF7674F|nr:myogenesis-regulating glycosidase [Tribolium madens]